MIVNEILDRFTDSLPFDFSRLAIGLMEIAAVPPMSH
jgi:hypothetical protein